MTIIVCGEAAVAVRLAEMDLTRAVLVDAVHYGLGIAADCTENDPPALAGLLAWGKTIRRLRDSLRLNGWRNGNGRNYATVIHPAAKLAITTAAGDAHTGDPERTPSTRSEKGPATREAVSRNQLEFADIDGSAFPAVAYQTPKQTWLLLHRRDPETDEILCELSLPASMTPEGYVTLLRERIVLSDTDADPSHFERIRPAAGDEIDVPIKRRTS